MDDYQREINKERKIFFIVVPIILILALIGISLAFFNYTRTGSANTIKVGRIAFNTNQTKTINLSNVFPIDSSKVATDIENVGKVEIAITGDTDYVGGIEYLVSSEDTHLTVTRGNKKIDVPISVNVDVTNLGTENNDYWNARESKDTTIYKKIINDVITTDQMLLVGYIKPNTTSGTAEGINGKVTITAYIDKNLVSITDTYDGTESDENGTTENWVNNRVTLTSSEWNSLQSSGLSFKVKVEANEGIWVTGSLEEIMKRDNQGIDIYNGVLYGNGNGSANRHTKGVFTFSGTQNQANPIIYYKGDIDSNNVLFANHCWKAIRTTDTGGVKLIYNGELGDTYRPGDAVSESYYQNVKEVSTPFSFDSSDNTWNITISDNSHPYIEFNVAGGDDYSMVITGTTGTSTGGGYYFYKNGSTVYANGGGGGQIFDETYNYGTLTSSDVIKFQYQGSSTVDSPITFKIKMQKNGVTFNRSDYIMEEFTYNQNENTWQCNGNKDNTLEFNISTAGDYFVSFINPAGGYVYVYVNGNSISQSKDYKYAKLGNIQPTDRIKIIYDGYGNNTEKFQLYVAKPKNIGLGCGSDNDKLSITLDVNGTETDTFNYSTADGKINSLAYVGYMYGVVHPVINGWLTSGVKYGTGYTWDGSMYHLINDTVSSVDSTHHYSCNLTTSNGSCEELAFVYSTYMGGGYVMLKNGQSVDDIIRESNENITDSYAKQVVDRWYENNLLDYTNKIEDTVYCNDRRVGNYNGWDPNGGDITQFDNLTYAADLRKSANNPSLYCEKNDSFTVSKSVGNQQLTYPIGLVTSDEVLLAGSNAYLYSKRMFLTMSPSALVHHQADVSVVSYGSLSRTMSINKIMRPVISIKPGQLIKKGTGTSADPYVIE